MRYSVMAPFPFLNCDHGPTRSSSFCRGMGDLGKLAAWNLCFRPSRVSLGGDSPESRFPEALPMRQLRLFADNPPGPRWISPPWTTASDRWLEIELDLPADHRARRFAEIVAELDLTALVGSYAGLGSPAYPPRVAGAAGPLRDPPRLPESGPTVTRTAGTTMPRNGWSLG